MINASHQDYDAMTERPGGVEPGWTPDDFAALGAFMESFNQDLAESGELVDTRGLTASGAHPADLPAGRRPGGDRRAYAEAEEVPVG